MTFTQIQTEIKERLLLTSTTADARIGRLINKVYRAVTTSVNLQTSRMLEVNTTTTKDSADVTFTTIEKIERVWIKDSAGNPTVLTPVLLDELRKENPPTADEPTRYAVRVMGANSVTIQLDKIAATAYNIFADVIDQKSDLSGSAEPVFSESFHDIIIEGVLKDEYRKQNNLELAKESRLDYEGRLSQLRMFILKSNLLEIKQGGAKKKLQSSIAGGGSGSANLGQTAYTQSALITYDLGTSAPFAVANSSAAVVTNLDADKLDGQHGAFYRDVSNANAGTLAVGRGGTGVASYSVGDILNATASTTLAAIAAVALGQVFTSQGTTTSPVWSAAPEITTIELGHATDTTLARVSAGVVSIQGTNIAKVSDKLSVFAATTSAELAGVISDETGSGLLVFATSPTLLGNIVLGGASTASELRFLEPSAGGTSYTGFIAPALAGNVIYTLPIADGTTNQFLQTDGSAALAWATPA